MHTVILCSSIRPLYSNFPLPKSSRRNPQDKNLNRMSRRSRRQLPDVNYWQVRDATAHETQDCGTDAVQLNCSGKPRSTLGGDTTTPIHRARLGLSRPRLRTMVMTILQPSPIRTHNTMLSVRTQGIALSTACITN